MLSMPGAKEKRAWIEKSRPLKKALEEESQKMDWNQAVDKAANKNKWGEGVKKGLKK